MGDLDREHRLQIFVEFKLLLPEWPEEYPKKKHYNNGSESFKQIFLH